MNTPAFDPDDPRLTAYALGEATPAEREETERLLSASPEARTEVEQTAALARALEDEYHRENEAYWETRRGKIIEFPARRRAGWNPAATFAWKIAAVLVALGVLVHFTLQRKTSPTAVVVASRPMESARPPAPVLPPSDKDTQTAGTVAQVNAPTVTGPDASSTPPAETAKPLLAMDSDHVARADTLAAPAAVPQATPALASGDASRTAARRPVVVDSAAPGAPAAASGGGMISPVERVARSLVRIRAGGKAYVGGVAVAADGWILAARSLPTGGTRPIVLLPDHRETDIAVVRENPELGLCRVRIEGIAPPAIELARAMPANKAALTVTATDARTGETRFLRAKAVMAGAESRVQWDDRPPTNDETSFVFNANGELLALTTAGSAAKADARSQPAAGRARRTESTVRPFTAAERAALQPWPQTPP